MDGTYHRFRTGTDIVLEILDRFASFTPRAESIGVPRVSLSDRLSTLLGDLVAWGDHPLAKHAAETLAKQVPRSELELRYGHYLQFFPQLYRLDVPVESNYPTEESAAMPPVAARSPIRIAEATYPFGQISDPLLGLAMVWIYDCYPFVHTGFVEQYLMRNNVSRRDFAVRLTLQSLATLVREVPIERVETNDPYATDLTRLIRIGLEWMTP
jgi:hypothetical protein